MLHCITRSVTFPGFTPLSVCYYSLKYGVKLAQTDILIDKYCILPASGLKQDKKKLNLLSLSDDQQSSLIYMMSEFGHEDHAFLVRVQMILDDGRHIG